MRRRSSARAQNLYSYGNVPVSTPRPAGEFFDGYAHDFDAIYGGRRGGLGRMLDRVFRRSMLLRYERAIAGCRPSGGCSILDVGCGPGHYDIALARAGAAKVVGVDPAPEMLAIARRRAEQTGVSDVCEYHETEFLQYEPHQRFDYCIIMGVMDYIGEPEPFLRHALRLTKSRVFLSFPKDGGILAAIRRYRYRSRTALHLYRRQQLERVLNTVVPKNFAIDSIARDFFVRIDI